jgi:phage baseplate assembly protein W
MSAIRHPYGFDGHGRTASATVDERIRQLLEQVVFTSSGERVNRPSFGSGVSRLVFALNSDATSSATQLVIQAALTQWLGDLVQVQAVDVANDGSQLSVTIQYVVRRSQEQRLLQVAQEL